MIDETELFFAGMLRENHPIEEFIDPDFSYRNANLNGDKNGQNIDDILLSANACFFRFYPSLSEFRYICMDKPSAIDPFQFFSNFVDSPDFVAELEPKLLLV